MVTHKQMLSPELADAAFALDEGAFSDPVQGPLGWVIVHARKIEPAKPSTFDQVKDELRKEMELEIARDQVYDIQNNIEDARAGGEPLADIAARNNLTVRSFSGITADGKTRGGDPVELPDLPELLTTVYANQAGEQIPPLNTNGDGYYWIEIDGVTPPELRPLADVRADVVKLWKEKKREAELEEMAIKMSARGNAGESFEKLAGEINRGLLTAPGIQRYTQSDTFSRTAVSRLFAASEGGFTYGPVGLGDSLIVMQVKEIRDPSQDTSSEAYKKTEADVLDSIQADMISSFIVGYQKELGVSVNAPLLQRLTVTDSNR
jgi:peptidyl-prolyl cis-trans isomerase D